MGSRGQHHDNKVGLINLGKWAVIRLLIFFILEAPKCLHHLPVFRIQFPHKRKVSPQLLRINPHDFFFPLYLLLLILYLIFRYHGLLYLEGVKGKNTVISRKNSRSQLLFDFFSKNVGNLCALIHFLCMLNTSVWVESL